MRGRGEVKRFGIEVRLNKFSDEQFIQPRICAEASQIPVIAEQNLKFCSRSSALNASEWRKTNGSNNSKCSVYV